MKKPLTSKLKSVQLAITMFIGLTFLSTMVSAQRMNSRSRVFRTSPKYFFAIESGVGTTSLTFKSDIEDLKDLKFSSQGWNVGLIGGNSAIKLRVNYGTYSYQKSAEESINQKLLSAKINISSDRLFEKLKYFRMYVITGADYSTFSFDGITIPKFKDPNQMKIQADKKKCCCEPTPGGPPPDPGAPTLDADQADELATDKNGTVDPKSVSLKKAQIDTGLGFEVTTTKKGKYYRMFAEAHYGIPLKEVINDLSLNNTSLSSQLVINIGISLGIGK